LAGTTVLDLSRLQPGGFCTRLLVDLGADVVKVEAPGGDPLRAWPGAEPSPFCVALDRGKRSITLDLKHPRAQEVLHRLVAGADVLVESARPGTLARSGVGYAELSATNPRLVWCSITGFGQTGPYRDFPGHDITYLAYAGVLGMLTDLDEQPDQPALLLGGPIAGLVAATGIVAALAQRARTGRGCEVDASIADAALWLMTEQVTLAARGVPPFDLSSPARRVYRCGDGRSVSVAAPEPRTWRAFVEGLGLADLADAPGGPAGREAETVQRIATALAAAPAEHWVRELGSGGVGPVNDAATVGDDPHVQARGGVFPVALDGLVDRAVAAPLRFASDGAWTTASCDDPPPGIGVDTDAVLDAAGFSPAEIEELRAAGTFGRSGEEQR
jgi:alpha-methylacyl-CoA racemase